MNEKHFGEESAPHPGADETLKAYADDDLFTNTGTITENHPYPVQQLNTVTNPCALSKNDDRAEAYLGKLEVNGKNQ